MRREVLTGAISTTSAALVAVGVGVLLDWSDQGISAAVIGASCTAGVIWELITIRRWDREGTAPAHR